MEPLEAPYPYLPIMPCRSGQCLVNDLKGRLSVQALDELVVLINLIAFVEAAQYGKELPIHKKGLIPAPTTDVVYGRCLSHEPQPPMGAIKAKRKTAGAHPIAKGQGLVDEMVKVLRGKTVRM